ncbi:Xaa-Pro peptidase family protein [Bradyrhizobium sp. 15]|uniref:M24 family metallopeptidase n=1 Tax=Bradyrhizobium sp. 15 TaxID=2782633 RepID=UPI001FF93F76|nr:Xaa-Pro peptidase family protein [Bradyrhizobium sp. 15]MCK1440541.1 M24 family metallopeptidase [Bradyrhizobium sp. 15]
MPITKGPQAFAKSEYLRRLAAVKSEMTRRDIDALVVTDAASITYLTGYTARAGADPKGVMISIREEDPTIILRKMDIPAAVHQTFLERSKVIGYAESLVGNPEKDGYDTLIDFLFDNGLANRGVGLDMSALSVPIAEKFRRRLPEARIVDFTGAIGWIRTIKSDLEIAYMKEAAAITDAGIMRAAEVMGPNVREADVIAEIVGTLVRGTDGKAGTWMATPFLCSSPRTGTSHIMWSEDSLRSGSQINLEIAGVRHGYTAPMCRTYSIGKPSDRLRRTHEAHLAGLEAGISAIRPGTSCGDVARAIHGALKKHGFKKESRCGYAIGIDWREMTASFNETDETELKPNMTFHLHLGNWMIEEDFGYVISESIRVTDSGIEILTKAPRKLFELSDSK